MLIGYLKYTCVLCLKKVRLDHLPNMSSKTQDYYAKLFDRKLCSICIGGDK